MLNPFRNHSKIPKSAIPSDKESFIGSPTPFGVHPYKFVYYTRNCKYFIEFGGTPTSPKNLYSRQITKDEFQLYKTLKHSLSSASRCV